MSFDKQVSETYKACYFHIRALRHIRASLITEASKTIAATIVGSRLDFCNSLLAGTSVSNLTRLQRVQNTLARVVAQKPRFCHITPVLSDLHWFPIRWSREIITVRFSCQWLNKWPAVHRLNSRISCDHLKVRKIVHRKQKVITHASYELHYLADIYYSLNNSWARRDRLR